MTKRKPDPATHGPGGKPHPAFITDFLAAFKAAYPGHAQPKIHARGNGWVDLDGRSVRPSEIRRLTENHNSVAARNL